MVVDNSLYNSLVNTRQLSSGIVSLPRLPFFSLTFGPEKKGSGQMVSMDW